MPPGTDVLYSESGNLGSKKWNSETVKNKEKIVKIGKQNILFSIGIKK